MKFIQNSSQFTEVERISSVSSVRCISYQDSYVVFNPYEPLAELTIPIRYVSCSVATSIRHCVFPAAAGTIGTKYLLIERDRCQDGAKNQILQKLTRHEVCREGGYTTRGRLDGWEKKRCPRVILQPRRKPSRNSSLRILIVRLAYPHPFL